MEVWQKPGEVTTQAWPQGSANTCLQAGAALGGSGTWLQPGTEPDPGTRMLQTFVDRNSATAVSVAQTGQQIPKGVNESNSILAAVFPFSQTAPQADSSMQPFPMGFGELAHTASGHSIICQQEAPLETPVILGNLFLWCFNSDAARDVFVPLGQKYTPALLQTKRYLPLLPQSLRKIVFQVSNPSPHTLFEKQNISDGKTCHQSHTRTKPQSHKSRTSSHTSKLPVGENTANQSSKPSLPPKLPHSKAAAPINPNIGTESSRFPARCEARREEQERPRHREMLSQGVKRKRSQTKNK